jgi:uncharacterized membrane protein
MDFIDIALWVAQGLLAFAMIASGGMKAVTPREKLMERMKWVVRFPVWAPRAIGIAEILGGIGLIAPWATGILPILTPIAAMCLVILMVGAVKAHFDDGEASHSAVPAVLAALGLGIAFGRAFTG